MTQEQKELLLKDLSARLPHGVKIQVNDKIETLEGIGIPDEVVDYDSFLASDLEEVKPYLFPLSSMAKEQEVEYDATFATIVYEDGRRDSTMTYKSFDWLNAHHFDYRGLIPMGLANDATGLNIY